MKRLVVVVCGLATLLASCATFEPARTGAAAGQSARKAKPVSTAARTTDGPGWEMPAEFRPTSSQQAAAQDLQVLYLPRLGLVRGKREDLVSLRQPLRQRRGVSSRAFRACRGLIENAAKSLGAAKIEAAAAGAQRRLRGGGIEAPMEFRILYPRSGGYEVRQAKIGCQLDAAFAPTATPIISARGGRPGTLASGAAATVASIQRTNQGSAAREVALEPNARDVAGGPAIPASRVAPSWEMPGEFRPASAARASLERVQVAYYPRVGYVQGRREHLLSFRTPLPRRPGVSTRALGACRKLIETAARSLGAASVEAVSAGPERRLASGGVEAPMQFRILYRTPSGYEIRQAKIGCQLDATFNPVATPVISA